MMSASGIGILNLKAGCLSAFFLALSLSLSLFLYFFSLYGCSPKVNIIQINCPVCKVSPVDSETGQHSRAIIVVPGSQ